MRRERIILQLERLEEIEAANNLLALVPPLAPAAMVGTPPPSEPSSPGVDAIGLEKDNQAVVDTKVLDSLFTEIASRRQAAQSGLDFSSIAGQPDTDSSSSLSDKQAQIAKTDAGQPPLPGDVLADLGDGAKAREKKPLAPQNQGGNGANNQAAAASGGASNLGTSTGTNSQGGGGGSSAGGGGSAGGNNLATLANEGAFDTARFGSAGASSTMPTGAVGFGSGGGSHTSAEIPQPTGTRTAADVALSGSGSVIRSDSASGSGGGISGSGTSFSALEGGLSNATGMQMPAVSPLVQGTAGTALSNVPVATFADPDPNGSAGDFTATINWGDNSPTTTGTVTALSTGGFSVAGSHTYTTSGTYAVQVTITDTASQSTATANTKAVINDASITATAATITATEATAANNVTVASFTDANPNEPVSSFSATIDWGDGSLATAGTISGSGGNFTVTGSHTYSEGGSYQVSVTIQSGMGSSAAVASTATVADLPLTGTGVTLTPAATGSSTTLAATFTDANTSEDPGNYMAQIDWGDGWTDDAAVSGSSGNYSLSGSHVYDHPGNYTVTVTVTDGGGATLTQTSSAVISAASLSATGATLYATSGQALAEAQIASFTDGNTDDMNDDFGPATGYTTTIDWGDGTGLDSSAVVYGDANGFYVIGGHTYSSPGAYTATVTVTNADGVSTTTTSTIDVTTMTPTGATFGASEGVAVNNVTVANFTDTQSDTYSALIDWGDGSTPTSGVVSGSDGNYSVAGSHTYADGGAYSVTVTITNSEGLSTVAVGTANVTDAALTATPETIATPANAPLNNVTVATFTDANPNEPISSYSASIDWGDGSPTDEGTISLVNGVYTVTGSHSYQTEGTFPITVYIGDDGGATTTADSSVTVTAPVINATPVDLSAQEGVALSNVTVATFTAPGLAGDYAATIDWGDGNTSTGTVTGSNGNFSVTGSNTYEEETGGQEFAVTVTITDMAGDTATVLSSATVDGGTLTPAGASLNATEAASSNFTLATFTDTDPSYAADEFTATVDFGDGTQDVAAVSGSNGTYTVMDTHTYAEDGQYTAVVSITDPNGDSTQTVSDTVTVADAALTNPGTPPPIQATQGVALNAVALVRFNDADTSDPSSTYTATINWGDGSANTTGAISGAGGLFSVSGSHTYASPGSYSASVTIADAGSSQVVIPVSVSVVAPPIYTVATFSDPNFNDTASQFTASINWGDNTSSSGTVNGSSGSFSVTASHAYAEEGTYSVSVTISGPGGPITVHSTAQVGDPSLLASQAPQAPAELLPKPAEEPSVKIDFGGAKMNAIAATPDGLRIHIDDNFYMRMTNPLNPTTLIADYLQGRVLPNLDSNLVRGTITIGPVNTQGTLVWSIPPGVRVWWQPVKDGPWELVKSGGKPGKNDYKATGQPIPIAIQGISPGGGPQAEVTVEYRLTGQDTPVTASFFYNVYTGLSVIGDSDPQQQFVQQIEQASGYGLTIDNNGNVWRTSMPALMLPNQVYMGWFTKYFDQILNNTDYGGYLRKTPTTKVTAVATPDLIPFIPDSYDLKSMYPNNISEITNQINKQLGNDEGSKVAAAMIIQALQEQYQTQIKGLKFETIQKPFSGLDIDHAGAVGAALAASQAVLGWGNRQQQPTKKNVPLGGPQFVDIAWWIYTDPQTKKVTFLSLAYDPATLKLIVASVHRPG
jgi:PKD repeat protein